MTNYKTGVGAVVMATVLAVSSVWTVASVAVAVDDPNPTVTTETEERFVPFPCVQLGSLMLQVRTRTVTDGDPWPWSEWTNVRIIEYQVNPDYPECRTDAPKGKGKKGKGKKRG
jgi:hypothetical protein